MASHKRICFCCSKEYEYCHTCNNHKVEPEWKMLFHDGNCKAAYDIWQAYRGNEIDNDTLVRTLRSMDLSKILAADTLVSKDFKKILSVQEETENKIAESSGNNVEIDKEFKNEIDTEIKDISSNDEEIVEQKKTSTSKKKK